ncbi:MAG: methionyl-tRNA formyltransferase, partial [Campylobacterales bacterium]|nr:methionyl-tRNA formyltransferase [Campylobacterales bacterium]
FTYIKTDGKNSGELFNELADVASDLTIETLLNFQNIKPLPQNHCDFNYAKKIKKQNGLVDFTDLTTLKRKFLGYTPWPGVFLESGLKLLEIEPIEDGKNYHIGEIVTIDKDFISIGCLVGKCNVYKVQPQSKKPMDVVSYIRGKRLEVGDTLS